MMPRVRRIAMTCNGPGEFAGWVRPLVRMLYELAPDVELHCFFVPDDYATGRESEVARESLPMLAIHAPKEYLQFALGAGPKLGGFDAVIYLGGDVMHASRLHERLGGALCAYRYAPRKFAQKVVRAFALDERNRDRMAKTLPTNKIIITGNLAVDGALAQANATFGVADRIIENGVIFLPGSRRNEIANLVPFFATAAMRFHALRPHIPISFGISPFTIISTLHEILQAPSDPRVYALQGRVVDVDGAPAILMEGSQTPFPIVRDALQTAVRSRLAVTIPGTKCIELAALGVPTIACIPFNLPEKVVINGALTYLDRVPVIGTPLKRAAVLAFAKRFTYYTQPNMDSEEMLIPELSGTLTPGVVAKAAADVCEDEAWRRTMHDRLSAIYLAHHGATRRMSEAVLELM